MNQIETGMDVPSHVLDVSGIAVGDLMELPDTVFAGWVRRVSGDIELSDQDFVSPFGSAA